MPSFANAHKCKRQSSHGSHHTRYWMAAILFILSELAHTLSLASNINLVSWISWSHVHSVPDDVHAHAHCHPNLLLSQLHCLRRLERKFTHSQRHAPRTPLNRYDNTKESKMKCINHWRLNGMREFPLVSSTISPFIRNLTSKRFRSTMSQPMGDQKHNDVGNSILEFDCSTANGQILRFLRFIVFLIIPMRELRVEKVTPQQPWAFGIFVRYFCAIKLNENYGAHETVCDGKGTVGQTIFTSNCVCSKHVWLSHSTVAQAHRLCRHENRVHIFVKRAQLKPKIAYANTTPRISPQKSSDFCRRSLWARVSFLVRTHTSHASTHTRNRFELNGRLHQKCFIR